MLTVHTYVLDQPRRYSNMVTILRMVTIQLQPFLQYMNLAPQNSYRTGIWLSNIIHRCQGDHRGG